MKINLKYLEEKNVCEPSVEAFKKHFGEEASLKDVLKILEKHERTDWAEWLADEYNFNFDWGWFSYKNGEREGKYIYWYSNGQKNMSVFIRMV